MVLQEAAEYYLVRFFDDSNVCVIHKKEVQSCQVIYILPVTSGANVTSVHRNTPNLLVLLRHHIFSERAHA